MNQSYHWQQYYLDTYLDTHPMESFWTHNYTRPADVTPSADSVTTVGLVQTYKDRPQTGIGVIVLDDGRGAGEMPFASRVIEYVSVCIRYAAENNLPVSLKFAPSDRRFMPLASLRLAYGIQWKGLRLRDRIHRVLEEGLVSNRWSIRQKVLNVWPTDPKGMARYCAFFTMYGEQEASKFLTKYCKAHGLRCPIDLPFSSGKKGWRLVEKEHDNPLSLKEVEDSMKEELAAIRKRYSAMRRAAKKAGRPLFMDEVLNDLIMLENLIGTTPPTELTTTLGKLREMVLHSELVKIREAGR